MDLETMTIIGNLADLKTRNKTSIVEAINELIRYVSANKKLVGVIQYLILDSKKLNTLTPNDLDICFCYDTKRWMYYSTSQGEWVLLPDGWAKLNNIIRMFYDLPDQGEIGKTYGVLHDSKIYMWNGEGWQLYYKPITDTICDEYKVQYIVTEQKTQSGSLLLTESGWGYVFD